MTSMRRVRRRGLERGGVGQALEGGGLRAGDHHGSPNTSTPAGLRAVTLHGRDRAAVDVGRAPRPRRARARRRTPCGRSTTSTATSSTSGGGRCSRSCRSTSSRSTTRSADVVLAEGHTGPLGWDGEDATLPDGIDDALRRVVAERRAGRAGRHAVRARRRGLARARASAGWPRELLGGMRELARPHAAAPADRAGAAVMEGALSARADRALRGVAARGRRSCSTRGCACTSGSARASPRRCRGRC